MCCLHDSFVPKLHEWTWFFCSILYQRIILTFGDKNQCICHEIWFNFLNSRKNNDEENNEDNTKEKEDDSDDGNRNHLLRMGWFISIWACTIRESVKCTY